MNVRIQLAAILVAAPIAAACTGAVSAPPAGEPITGVSQAALDQSNGGMTTADEAPAFADPKVEAVAPFEPIFADAADPTIEIASKPAAKSFHIALFWGHLPTPHDADPSDVAPEAMTWTGSVSVDKGAINVKRTLAFDAKDKVEPRSAPNSVAFESHTLPFVDGLFLRVAVPEGAPATLHFATKSLTTDIDLALLGAKAGGVVRLADERNGLAYIGYPDVAGCARGLTYGRWVKSQKALGGFRGRVVDGEGETIGHVRGLWGHAPKADKNVFFGKYIALDGSHRGLLGGVYGGGEAQGVWGTRDPKDAGGLQVFYSDGYDQDDGRGVFVGRWSEKCAL